MVFIKSKNSFAFIFPSLLVSAKLYNLYFWLSFKFRSFIEFKAVINSSDDNIPSLFVSYPLNIFNLSCFLSLYFSSIYSFSLIIANFKVGSKSLLGK